MPIKEFRKCMAPLEQYKSSGPFMEKRQQRLLIHLLKEGEPAKTWTYARYLYSVKVGHIMPPSMEIDHKDGNRFNDTINNLQALESHAHSEKSKSDPRVQAMAQIVQLVCPACEQIFTRNVRQTHLSKGYKKTFCSRSCSVQWRKYKTVTQDVIYIPSPEVSNERKVEPWEEWSSEMPYRERYLLKDQNRVCSFCPKVFTPKYAKQEACSVSCASKTAAQKRAKTETTVFKKVVSRVLKEGLSWEAAGRELHLSGNAVKKRAKKMGYTIPKRK